MPRPVRLMLRGIGLVCGLYVALALIVFIFQAQILFPRHPTSKRSPAEVGFSEFENVSLPVGGHTTTG